jgi:hypothetical protein
MGLSNAKASSLLLVALVFIAMAACKPKAAESTEAPAEEAVVENVEGTTCTEGAVHDSSSCGEAIADEAAPAGDATVQE